MKHQTLETNNEKGLKEKNNSYRLLGLFLNSKELNNKMKFHHAFMSGDH